MKDAGQGRGGGDGHDGEKASIHVKQEGEGREGMHVKQHNTSGLPDNCLSCC